MVRFTFTLIRLVVTLAGTPKWVTFVLMLVLIAVVVLVWWVSTSVNFSSSAFRLCNIYPSKISPMHR